MDQFEIEEVKEELQYHKSIARVGLTLIDQFLELDPALNKAQMSKLKMLRKILADATI